MRIFAFRSFRAAAPGLMEFTQQQRYLFICSAQPASPSTSICFSGQDSSFSTINMHFMECNGTHVQSAGKSAAQFCTYAHLHAQGILSRQDLGLCETDRDSWTAVTCDLVYLWRYPDIPIRAFDYFSVCYNWASLSLVSLQSSDFESH